MPDPIKIALHGKVFNDEVKPFIKKVIDYLKASHTELLVSKLFAKKFNCLNGEGKGGRVPGLEEPGICTSRGKFW
jgi:hypothetical protein